MKLVTGNYYTLGQEYAEKYFYKRFVGSKVAFVKTMDKNTAIVRITLLPPEKQILSCYVGESIMVHLADILPFTEGVFPQKAEEEELVPQVNQVIEIKGNFADKMNYEPFVGSLAVVKEVQSAVCEVELFTGELFDVHLKDVKFIERSKEGTCFALIDLKDECIYYTDDHAEFKQIRQVARTNNERYCTRVGRDLTDMIDAFPNCTQFYSVKEKLDELKVKINQ